MDPENSVHVSVISLWEISIKAGLGKLTLHGADVADFPGFVTSAGWNLHPLEPGVASTYGRLPRVEDHRDPFDRLIVWTALCERFTLVSGDRAFSGYAPHGLKLCW
jgi:PIN domain nuclease of toxin-antitoxin system